MRYEQSLRPLSRPYLVSRNFHSIARISSAGTKANE